MARGRLVLVLGAVLLGAACGGAPEPSPSHPLPSEPLAGEVGAIEVASGPALGAAAVRVLEAGGALAVLRQSARDWLEQRGRLAADGQLELRIEVTSLHLRSSVTVWLLSALAAPDHLEVQVVALRSGEPVREFRVRAESALSGFAWRDPGERLRRLARRVGRRLVEGV